MRLAQHLARSLFSILVVGLSIAVLGGASAIGQDVVKVEEDWQLVLGEPDNNSVGPQIACAMSPYGNLDSTYFTFEVNHRSAPYWTPGGLTIHQWSGDWRIQSYDRADRSVMNTNDETVTWTQLLDTTDGHLTFQVKNGASSTWGPFGYSNHFKLFAWGVDHLNDYSPAVSVAQSGVAYAGNRVRSLKILQVRLTLSDGTTITDNTVRVVHRLVE
jgi:hypothetical protein